MALIEYFAFRKQCNTHTLNPWPPNSGYAIVCDLLWFALCIFFFIWRILHCIFHVIAKVSCSSYSVAVSLVWFGIGNVHASAHWFIFRLHDRRLHSHRRSVYCGNEYSRCRCNNPKESPQIESFATRNT